MLILHFKVEKAEVHGFVETVATGNGVLLYGLSDSWFYYRWRLVEVVQVMVQFVDYGGLKHTRIRRPVIKNKALPVTTTATSITTEQQFQNRKNRMKIRITNLLKLIKIQVQAIIMKMPMEVLIQ